MMAQFVCLTAMAVGAEIGGLWYDLVSEVKEAKVIPYKNNIKYSGDVVIPETVDFEGAKYGVTSIGEGAFCACSGLRDVYCYALNVPNTDSSAFNSSPIAEATLHVPISAIEEYKTTAPWSGFGNVVAIIIEGDVDGIGSLTPAISEGEGTSYDLNGRRVANPAKGLYIKNGKKVVVK